ncbi:DUF4227 family protein [Paenibacillus puldeungensis]
MMIISIRQWLRAAKYLLLFVALAYTLYRVLGVMDNYLLRENKYRIPEGSAVKVFHAEMDGSREMGSIAERLKLFFWYGE